MITKLKVDNDWDAVLKAKEDGYLTPSIIYLNDLKVSDRIMEKSFWLGLYPGLNKDHIQYISRIIHNYFKKA